MSLNWLNFRTVSQQYSPCLASGLLLGLSYPSYPFVRLEVLAWVWMVPMLLALREIKSFWRFLSRVYLTTLVVSVFGEMWLAMSHPWGAVLLFIISAAVLTVPFTVFYFIRQRLGWRAALWSAPVIWTAWDWLYHQTDGSFGWLALGVTQSNLYWLTQYIDLTGAWGITFWLVLFNVLVVMAVEDRSRDFSLGALSRPNLKPRRLLRRLAVVSATLLLPPLAYSAYIFTTTSSERGREITILQVQPNVNPWQKFDRRTRATSLGQITALTDTAVARQKADLVIWPESAVPYLFFQENEAREFVYQAVGKWQMPLLTGTLDRQAPRPQAERPARLVAEPKNQELFNAAVLLVPAPSEGGQERLEARPEVEPGTAPHKARSQPRVKVWSSELYYKQVLMPFVERVPFADQFSTLSRLLIDVGGRGSFGVGHEATVFSFEPKPGETVTVAAPLCYEQLYPAKMAEFVRQGAELLAVLTNEGYFSQTHGQYQLAAFTRLRAIETRRSIARTANTGLTCVIDPLGRISAQAPWWEATTLVSRLRLSKEQSFYVRYPDYLPRLCVWLTLLLGVAAVMLQLGQRFWLRLSQHVLSRWAWQRRADGLNQ